MAGGAFEHSYIGVKQPSMATSAPIEHRFNPYSNHGG